MRNHEAARILANIAGMLEIKGDNPYKIRAYRIAAEAIINLDEDLAILKEKDRLSEIPGVGKAVKAKIEELLEKGSLEYYERLSAEVPPGLMEMLRIPGLGPKSVKVIFDNTGISSLDELLKAAQDKKIRNLPGLGAKTEDIVINGIETMQQDRGKETRGLAWPAAQDLLHFLLDCGAVIKADIVGSLRRGKPLVSDIDILAASRKPENIYEALLNYNKLDDVIYESKDHIQGHLFNGMEFEIIIVEPELYYPALTWTTGSKVHREIIFKDIKAESLLDVKSENDVYKHLGMSYIDPELRENRGEIEMAHEGRLPELVKFTDIKGDLHNHTNWSDGVNKIEEMAAQAESLGYEYLAVTDHSKSLNISKGLDEARLAQQSQTIDNINNQNKITILKGTEVDILKNGQLDFNDDILQELDIVVASVHSYFKLDKEEQTDRIITAIKNPHVDIIAHLSGRLLKRRPAYELDIEKILDAAANNQTVLEINAHPDRLDIDEEIAKQAKDLGIKIAVNSDAHHLRELNNMHYGITSARRSWLEASDIINTYPLEDLLDYLG
ncbi:DNA polymerase/3'-5' exonuclease PolX [Syntrophomonas palmitatica]|uniref:DNA polymerase/3'-5' exonuclease PolX n=1 Tax=Syntrophomonas palmitatica TaxID=402877 RepID=UPI0006D1934E|nr:DNA polymerase/3'-5' exonuclease PolX [Syntrophomonas palmitatica]